MLSKEIAIGQMADLFASSLFVKKRISKFHRYLGSVGLAANK